MVVSPWIEGGVVAYTGDRKRDLNVSLGTVNQTLPATVTPASASVVRAGVALTSTGHWSAQLAYTGQFSRHSHMNTESLKVVYRW